MKFSGLFFKSKRRAEEALPDVLPENVVLMSDYKPHAVSELICVKCGHRWIGVYQDGA